MRIAVAGTGGLAQHIARAITSQKHEVIMLSRFERPELTMRGFVVIRVDYNSPSSINMALCGVDTVISTISNEPQLALIDSCLTTRVRRFAPAEFEGLPYERPMIEQHRDKINTLNRLREVRHRLQSAVFCCGLFYEWFFPGGMLKSGVSTGSVVVSSDFGADGAFLVDMKRGKATIPAFNEGGGEVHACFTAAEDVGKFVARCLEIENWPEQLRMSGERLKLVDIVEIVESVMGHSFDVTYPTSEELHDQLLDAEEAPGLSAVFLLEELIAIQRGEFDFRVSNVNELFPDIEPMALKTWLQKTWKGR